MKNTIRRMLTEGRSYSEIIEAVGCSRSTISYHAKGLGLTIRRPKYDWKEIAKFYESHSYTETRKKFKFSGGAWELAIARGDILSRGYSDILIPLDNILVQGSTYARKDLKKRLLQEGLLRDQCYNCGLPPHWDNNPLVLQIDHINGINNDNRIENLQMLCPNCHTQTLTFGGKNLRKQR